MYKTPLHLVYLTVPLSHKVPSDPRIMWAQRSPVQERKLERIRFFRRRRRVSQRVQRMLAKWDAQI